jgi:hypothetical protein
MPKAFESFDFTGYDLVNLLFIFLRKRCDYTALNRSGCIYPFSHEICMGLVL